MDRTCWICFTPESETPSHVRWTSPCRCRGDTQWAHEPCLLTWIIRQQSQKISDGDVGAVIVHEGSADSVDYIDHNGEKLTESQRQRIQKRVRLVAEFGDKLIRCPQCHTPYELQLPSRPLLTAAFMDTYTLFSSLADFFVPYTIAVGGTTLIIWVSVTYGVYTIVTVCGPNDILVRHLTESSWTFRELLGVFSVPYALSILKSSHVLRTTAVLSSLTLSNRYLLIPYLRSQGYLAPSTASPSALVETLQQRSNILLGLLALKYIYRIIHNNLLVPVIVGARPTSLINGSPEINEAELLQNQSFQEYLNVDLVEAPQQNNELSVFSVTKLVSEILLTPAISSFTGSVLRSVTNGLLMSSILANKAWAGKLLNVTSKFDIFTWSVIGGCTFAFTKVSFRIGLNLIVGFEYVDLQPIPQKAKKEYENSKLP